APVHSCMGLPLYSDQKVIGLVTIDSLQSGSFNAISPKTLELIAALSAATLKTALEFKKLEISAQHAQQLVQELTQEALLKDGGELIGQSTAMQTLKNEIQLVAGSDYTVLITGETGVGKELVARTVHQLSLRKYK
ncbi:MAG TPA: nitric oxide reductase transcription regulator, partial [Methylophaga sp.]|nr:nitric oxide reductase transcription regulator [Methylophaga sp.]